MFNLTSACNRAQLLFVARIFVTVLLSTSIYISSAKCPMVRGEPIRWQIRCQLRGSCLETITASLPPQFKFQTLQRRSSQSLGSAYQQETARVQDTSSYAVGLGWQQIKENPNKSNPKRSIFTGLLFSWTCRIKCMPNPRSK